MAPDSIRAALNLITAVLEANQGLAHKIEPCVLCSYDVDCDDIADLRTNEDRAEHGIRYDDMACAWFSFVIEGRQPPSWKIAQRLIDKGYAGMISPSFAHGATSSDHNLVLWDWSGQLPHQVIVHDPSGRLPKDQLSWR